jgi:hypothetical protein
MQVIATRARTYKGAERRSYCMGKIMIPYTPYVLFALFCIVVAIILYGELFSLESATYAWFIFKAIAIIALALSALVDFFRWSILK